MTNPSEYTLAQAADPSTPAATLGEIATHRPDLRAAVAGNPTAYPELLDWLRSFADPSVDAALAARGAAAPTAATTPVPAPDQGPATEKLPTQHAGQPGYPGHANETQQLPTQPAAWGQQPTAQQPAASGQPASQQGAWGQQPPADPNAAWGQPAAAQQDAWAQQPTAAPAGAWGQQPPADPNAAWSPQGAGAPGAAWGQPAPYGQQGQPGAPKKSRKGLWIGVGVAAALLVGGGAFAANALWFSKVGGASSPEAAATQLIESAVAKDLVGVYGVTAPSEFSSMTTALDLFSARLEGNDDYDVDQYADAYKDYLDGFDLQLEGLEVEVEEIEDGLAKVSIVSGDLTVDADADKLSDATVSLFDTLDQGPLGELFDSSGVAIPSDTEIRDSITDAVEETFPVEVSAADLQLDPSELGAELGIDLGDEPIDPFLMVVREDGDWYVSPMLTLAEYGAVSQGVERGSLPSEDLAGRYDTPEAAAEGLVTGLKAYIETGDHDAYLAALPLADRRLATLYASSDLDSADLAEFQEVLENTDLAASFTVREEDDGVAWLQLESMTVSTEYEGTTADFELDAECFSADVDGEKIRGCLDDIPALTELGVGELSLIAVEEDGSWYISSAATVGDSSGVLLSHALTLYDEGKLTDPTWWEDNLGVLADQLF